MRVEEVVSSFIMFIVSGLVLVGFTIAWYTNNHIPAVTGMSMVAADMGDVKVALKEGDPDISELTGDDKYADIGMEKFVNYDMEKLAPGTCGAITFYVTPTKSSVTACKITPTLYITQNGTTWYPAEESVSGGDAEADVSDGDAAAQESTIAALYEITQRHIQLFSDEEMTKPIAADGYLLVEWTLEERLQEEPVEKTVPIYWKWHYEYPFTEEEKETMSDAEKELAIDKYDEEDMLLGNFISGMKFYFTFVAQ